MRRLMPEYGSTILSAECALFDSDEKVAPIYARHLSVEDMNTVIKFYRTETGNKFVKKMPIISKESFFIGQQWGKELGEKVLKKLQDGGYLQQK